MTTNPKGRFEAFGLAARRATITGRADARDMERMDDLLAPGDEDVPVDYRISGTTDARGQPALEVEVAGTLPLVCQRCLQTFAWPVTQTTLLLLARDEGELARLDEGDPEHEVIAADAPLDPKALVEDELVLTVPFVPRCAEENCGALGEAADTEGARVPSAERSKPPSAFAVLADLKAPAKKKSKR